MTGGLLGGLVAKLVEVTLRVERGHTAGAGAGDGLTVDVVLHVARRKYAGEIGGGSVTFIAAVRDDIAAFQGNLAFEKIGVGLVADGNENAGECEVFGATVARGALQAHAGDAGFIAQHFVEFLIEFERDVARSYFLH